ncbi:MAG: VWA domain-containing protein [Planctomycetes bacterium]|nr:VWA domain-containing protein [Planctomycetota bacterium]
MRSRMTTARGAVLAALAILVPVACLWLHGRTGKASDASLKASLDLPYDALGDGADEEDAPELVVFYGGEYEADAFFYCLDGSLSMADGEWQTLQRELVRNIREFRDWVEFGIVVFSQETRVIPRDKRPARATEAAKQAAIAEVLVLEPGSWTCALAGLAEVLKMARQSTAPRRAVIFMSDGKPACPGTDFVAYREQIFRDVQALNEDEIPIHAIGIGDDVDESFLRRLAGTNRGTYRRVTR